LVSNPSIAELAISGKYTAAVIASVIQMNITDFNSLNPNFDKAIASSGTFNLRLPNEKLSLFQANKQQILEQSVRMMLSAAR
jgi:membrane-bound lytic murein transglycosylase D